MRKIAIVLLVAVAALAFASCGADKKQTPPPAEKVEAPIEEPEEEEDVADESKPAAEAKPAESKPEAEAKPAEPKPAAEAKPAESKPATEAKPADPKPAAETKPAEKPAAAPKPEAAASESKASTVDWQTFLKDYEKWVDAYIAFYAKYKKNPSDMTLLTDYAKLAEEAIEWADKAEAMEDDISDADLVKYLGEVQRIVTKMQSALL